MRQRPAASANQVVFFELGMSDPARIDHLYGQGTCLQSASTGLRMAIRIRHQRPLFIGLRCFMVTKRFAQLGARKAKHPSPIPRFKLIMNDKLRTQPACYFLIDVLHFAVSEQLQHTALSN